MPDPGSLLGLVLIAPLLLFASYSDLRNLRIPNWVSLAMLAIFIGVAMTLPAGEITARLMQAAAVFGIGFILFALNTLGAGDVKLLSALMLFVPSIEAQVFFLILSPALLFGVALICLFRWRPPAKMQTWQSITTPGAFPMGISIATAGLALLPVLAFTQ